MKLTEIILNNFAPQNLRALWLQPKPNKTVAFKVFNNGVWMDTFEWQDLSGFLTKDDAAAAYQPIGDYALKSDIPSLAGYVTSDSLSSTLSDYLTLKDAQLGYQPKGDYALNSALTSGLAAKADNFTVGTGLEMTPERVINVTLDTTVFKVVSALPDTPDAGDENKIFLVPNPSSTDEGNYYTEYIWVVDTEHPDGHYEELGTYKSDVDLSTYQTKTDNNLQTTDKTIVGAINEVNSKLGYYVNITSLNNNSSSEEISEAIGGYDNLLNALNNKIPVYVYTTNGDEQFAIIIITNAIVSQNSIGLMYDSGTSLGIYTINNNSGILSCIVEYLSMQKTRDNDLNTSSKTIVGAINEINDKTPVYTTVPTLTADYTIPANATTREYIYEISIGATKYNVTAAEGIKWIDNNLPLVEANSKLIVSVVNNIAVWGTVYE